MNMPPEEKRMRERIFQELLDEGVFEHVDPEEAGLTRRFFNHLERTVKYFKDRPLAGNPSPEEIIRYVVVYTYVNFRGGVAQEELPKVAMIISHLESLQQDRLEEWAMLSRLLGKRG